MLAETANRPSTHTHTHTSIHTLSFSHTPTHTHPGPYRAGVRYCEKDSEDIRGHTYAISVNATLEYIPVGYDGGVRLAIDDFRVGQTKWF